MNPRERSFTLMELIIVVVIISVIAGFAIPSYQKAMVRTGARKTMLDMNVIVAAQQIYKAKHGHYWPVTSVLVNYFLDDINNNLGLNILQSTPDTAYRCYGSGTTGAWYFCEITDGNFLITFKNFTMTEPGCVSLVSYNACP